MAERKFKNVVVINGNKKVAFAKVAAYVEKDYLMVEEDFYKKYRSCDVYWRGMHYVVKPTNKKS